MARGSASSLSSPPQSQDGIATRSAVERAGVEPIAIIGIGCRFPGGAKSPAAFWQLLRDGVDAITPMPDERWAFAIYEPPSVARRTKRGSRFGGFLDLTAVEEFDAYFFGVSPREAAAMDPQHRLLLEVSWEALEDAGQVAERLAGGRTGVYVGISSCDFEAVRTEDRAPIDIYSVIGAARSVLAGRLSYAYGWQGPSLVTDTACSSSLVAVHLACQGLRNGECELALAGGVNLVLLPEFGTGFNEADMLAPDGRCKAFDARANGFVRSDGVAVVVLKPLSRAVADGDPICAVIRGSAVNNDGRSSGLLITPGQQGQEAVIREAYRNAGMAPGRVQYVEAHGTGTSVGDPVEARALAAVLSEGRPEGRPCWLGSVKTNIGHTEATAGAAGLIKVALALKHGLLPPSLHCQEPNPRIPWSELPLRVQRELTPWSGDAVPRLAGVSSFGIGGTNAHVVLEEAPASATPADASAEDGQPYLLPLSAKTPEALGALAESYRAFVQTSAEAGPSLRDICFTASLRRTHHDHRLGVAFASRQELIDKLEVYLRAESCAGLAGGRVLPGHRPRVVFVFPGQGSQWSGMGRQLMREEPVFREALERCDRALRAQVDWSLLELLGPAAPADGLDGIDVVQPATFAIQVALAALWRSWGIEPEVVVGHSMGEVAAAHVAGALSLDDAAAVICHRSRLLGRLSGQGAMATVGLALDEAEAALAGYEGRVSVAVSNGPTSTVLSGDPDALRAIVAGLEQRGVFCRWVNVDVASHSPQTDALRAELALALDGVRPRQATVPMYSTVTGGPIAGSDLDASYWVRNLRDRVLFYSTLQRLAEDGYRAYLELSPHPVLLGAVQQTIQDLGEGATWLPSLRRGLERSSLLASLGGLFAAGAAIDWQRLYPNGGRCVALPAYPWQHERFAIRGSAPANRRVVRQSSGGHPLLGLRFSSAAQAGTHLWETELSTALFPYLADHRVQQLVVLPAAAYLEMALAAAAETFGPGAHVLENVAFKKALFLPDQGQLTVQLVLTPGLAGTGSFQFFSRPTEAAPQEQPWTLHATGTVRVGAVPDGAGPAHARPEELRAACAQVVPAAQHYQAMRALGLEYGPSFQGVDQIWRRDGEALARLTPTDASSREMDPYQVFPTVLDAALQALAGTVPIEAVGGKAATYLPVGVSSLRLHQRPEGQLWSHAILRPGAAPGADAHEGDVFLLRDDGQVVLAVEGVALRRLEPERPVSARSEVGDWLYELRWERRARRSVDGAGRPASGRRGTWLVLADASGVGASLAGELEAAGERSVCVLPGEGYECLGPRRYRVNPARPDDFRRLLADALSPGEPPCHGVVHLWSLDAAPVEATSLAALEAAQQLCYVSTLHLVQALAKAGLSEPPQLWLVTQGMHPLPADGQTEDERKGADHAGARRAIGGLPIAQSPLWGLGRVVFDEHPELRCRLVDLACTDGAGAAASLVQELWSGEPENQVVLSGAERYVARLARSPGAAGTPRRPTTSDNTAWLEPAADAPFRLSSTATGVLDNLVLRAAERQPPGPGQVEIRVRAAGLNFSDVMKAMGIYPGLPEGAVPLGVECSGTVAALGEGVEQLRIGDDVVAIAPYPASCFGTYATVPASFALPKPARLSFEQATTIPVAFGTAYYALHHVGKLGRGERVLIHAAAGGVGLAAVELAHRAGAQIFATAGSPEKRAYLHSLGIEHVMDSRSLAFAEEVLERTGGRGVDVVLNSLAGEAIAQGLSVLAPCGRFLEIGKRDIYLNTQLGLLPFRKSIGFFSIDMDLLMRERPELMESLLGELVELFGNESLRPLPHTLFPISEAVAAFRYMAQAKNIGKIVLSLDDPRARPVRTGDEPLAFRADGTYLITGGLGGLGLSVAGWMVERGARNLVLLGRRRPVGAAREAVAALEQAGARVRVEQADVADAAQLGRVLDGIAGDLPPLRGAIHAAGVLDDGILLQQTAERFTTVMAPKIRGAWNLHALTADARLDFFVLFSSVASLVGSPGQANYSAANAFLDALAQHRSRQGLPALGINWGPWGEVGLAARPDRGGRLEQRGLASLTPSQGVEALGALLGGGAVSAAVMRADWAEWRHFNPAVVESPLLGELVRAETGGPADGDAAAGGRARAAILARPAEERTRAMEEFLVAHVAGVLGLPADKRSVLGPDQALDRVGLDSLMAIELKNRIELELAVSLPVAALLQGPSIGQLAAELLRRLPSAAPEPEASATRDGGAEEPPATVDQLTEAEVDALLAELLAEEQARP